MTESGQVGNSIEDLLVSLADGVSEAQQILRSNQGVDEFGQLRESYHFPYVDFEFDILMETVNSTSPGRTFLQVRQRKSGSETSSIKSSISGRLVAVPPGQGVPRPVVDLTSKNDSPRRWTIDLRASNDAGELLIGYDVELNVNVEASLQLSAANGAPFSKFPSGVALSQALLTTDQAGFTTTQLNTASSLPAGSFVVVTAELLGESHSHAIGI